MLTIMDEVMPEMEFRWQQCGTWDGRPSVTGAEGPMVFQMRRVVGWRDGVAKWSEWEDVPIVARDRK